MTVPGLCSVFFSSAAFGMGTTMATSHKKTKTVEADASLDWDQLRVRQILSNHGEITFEYNIAQDYLIMHHGGIDPQPKRYDRYHARIEKQSDWRICHESIPDVCRLFRDAIIGGSVEFAMDIHADAEDDSSLLYKFVRDIVDTLTGNRPISAAGNEAPDYYQLENITWENRRNQ